MDYENVLLVKNEVFLYRIPPRQSNRGYKATDWVLDSPFWTGRLRVVAKQNELTIKLEDRKTGELFAKCPVNEVPSIALESVLDSSRYFVIRLVSDDGRTMFMGIGFAERSDSFDLNVAIQDHFRALKQDKEAQVAHERSTNEPCLDFSMKKGEKIKLSLNTRRVGEDTVQKSKSSSVRLGSSAATGGSLLPPPPPPASSRSRGGRNMVPTNEVPGSITSEGPNLSNELTSNIRSLTSTLSNMDLLTDVIGSD